MIRNITSLLLTSVLAGCGASSQAGPTVSPDGAAAVPAESRPLDGNSFEVALTIGDDAPEQDVLRFEAGRFESTACTVKGFPQWTAYETDERDGATFFHVVTKHPRGTTVEWNGTVNDAAVEGTANIHLADGRVRQGTFRGQLPPRARTRT